MAIRVNASTDLIERTSSLPANDGPWTTCFWYYVSALRSAYQTANILRDSSATNYHFVGVFNDNTWYTEISGSAGGHGGAVSADTWYHLGIVRGAAANRTDFYVNGSLESQATLALAGTMSDWEWLNSLSSDWTDGRVYAIKAWDVALSLEEVLNERETVWPQRAANLIGWWPCFDATIGAEDWSGLGRNLTLTGVATEDSPPVTVTDIQLDTPPAAVAPPSLRRISELQIDYA